MQTEIDFEAAVAAGIIGEDQAIALRNFEAERLGMPSATAEKFLLFGGFHDLLNASALALVLVGLTIWLYDAKLSIVFLMLAPVVFALCTRINVRAMPLTTTVLMLSFVGYLLFGLPNFLKSNYWGQPSNAVLIPFGILPALIGAWIFWRTFRWPPIPAVVALLFSIAVAFPLQPPNGELEQGKLVYHVAILLLSFGVLAAAIWWDITDIRRETERSQVAFWLHCCAGFLLTHAAFSMISGNEAFTQNSPASLDFQDAIAFAMTFSLFAILSLLLDRRSLLVGSMLPSIEFFTSFGSEGLGILFAGCCLLFFTWAWSFWRRGMLAILPSKVAAQLPRTQIIGFGQRPTRRHLPLKPRTTDAAVKGIAMLFGTKSR